LREVGGWRDNGEACEWRDDGEACEWREDEEACEWSDGDGDAVRLEYDEKFGDDDDGVMVRPPYPDAVPPYVDVEYEGMVDE